MFNGSSSLKELNLINFNTDIIEDMQGIFQGCSSLKELNLTNFNTNNVTNMSWMFYGCSSLKELNLNNFNTNNVTDMSCMFFQGFFILDDLIIFLPYLCREAFNIRPDTLPLFCG